MRNNLQNLFLLRNFGGLFEICVGKTGFYEILKILTWFGKSNSTIANEHSFDTQSIKLKHNQLSQKIDIPSPLILKTYISKNIFALDLSKKKLRRSLRKNLQENYKNH